MRYSRGGVIAVLVAVEIFITGAILWSLGRHGFTVSAGGPQRLSESGKTFAPIDAGSAPHVVIDDARSGVGITASTDGKVHVTDASHAFGWFVGGASRPALQVSRTADGVLVARAAEQRVRFSIFGFDEQHIDVAVPPAALLEIRRCSGANVNGLTGQVRVHSVDGRITANHIHASALALSSDDGSLRLDDVTAPAIDASTRDGSIRAHALQVGGGTLHTDDGSVRVQLLPSNLTVRAHTADGSIYFNGTKSVASDSDEAAGEFQVGSGGSPLQVSSQDGSIHITTNGAQ